MSTRTVCTLHPYGVDMFVCMHYCRHQVCLHVCMYNVLISWCMLLYVIHVHAVSVYVNDVWYCCAQVMDGGQIVECAEPLVLLQDPSSVLKTMVDKTGPTASRELYQIAATAHQTKSLHL